MKTYVITVSKNFLLGHPRAGEPTFFKEKVLGGEKIHTIRANIKYWSNIVDRVNAGNAILSIREWEAEPYKSKQVEILQLTKIGKQFVYLNGDVFIYDTPEFHNLAFRRSYEEVAKNDGLTVDDFLSWFEMDKLIKNKTPFKGIIIHFTDFKY